MIHALDCITLGAALPDAALQSYAALLGHSPAADGTNARMQLANVRLEFVAKPSSADEGLAGVAFAVGDLAKARHLLERRGLRLHLADGDGDLILEVAHDLKAGLSDEPDKLWGLSWRAPDITQTHARVKSAGIEVSDIRVGRRPGTRLFTVRSHTAGVPTIMIGPDPPAA